MQTKVMLFGFGSLGKEIFKTLINDSNFKIVNVIDNDPSKIGRDPSIIALGKKSKIKIVENIKKAKLKPDIVVHATVSSLKDAHSQLSDILRARLNVVSTCEQLVYPLNKNRKYIKKLNLLAKKHNVSIVGIGVNPGFLMDSLVLMLSSLCRKIYKIRIERIVDLTRRRKALQKKMCLGLHPKQFQNFKKSIGHVGLNESATMICESLNIKTSIRFKISPILAKHHIISNGIKIKSGHVSGIKHSLVGMRKGSEFLRMNLSMYAKAKEYDMIEIHGIPPIKVKTSGINGDLGTISLLLNYIPIVLSAKPGFHTVNDLVMPKGRSLT